MIDSLNTIEDVILSWDKRNMLLLRSYLADDYCMEAARFIYDHPSPALIVTGFFEISPKVIETDGPPGALAIGRALQSMGRRVSYITDEHTVPFLRAIADDAEIVEFPITGFAESEAFARELLAKHAPLLTIAVERCGVTASGRYLNMSSQDISDYTAKMDYLFPQEQLSVGIGDGGNEIGMGNLAQEISQTPGFPDEPPVTRTTHLVISSVSNWGAYGVAAGLSMLHKRDLLPTPELEADMIRQMVDMGAVDGESLEPIYGVDGFPVDSNLQILDRLRQVIRANGVS